MWTSGMRSRDEVREMNEMEEGPAWSGVHMDKSTVSVGGNLLTGTTPWTAVGMLAPHCQALPAGLYSAV